VSKSLCFQRLPYYEDRMTEFNTWMPRLKSRTHTDALRDLRVLFISGANRGSLLDSTSPVTYK